MKTGIVLGCAKESKVANTLRCNRLILDWAALAVALASWLWVPVISTKAQCISCLMEFKVTSTNLYKCAFREYTNATPPLVHVYRNQTTHSFYQSSYIAYTTNGYTSPPGSDSWGDAYDGIYWRNAFITNDLTRVESKTGSFCDYTNTYAGSTYQFDESEDQRFWTGGNSVVGCTWSKTNDYKLIRGGGNVSYVFANDAWRWALVGQNNTSNAYTGGGQLLLP